MGHKLISTISEIETKCKTINSFKIITQIIKIFFFQNKKNVVRRIALLNIFGKLMSEGKTAGFT